MNKLLKEQVETLSKTLETLVDGEPFTEFPESFSTIIFKQSNNADNFNPINSNREQMFIFEDYMMKDTDEFNFHTKFNNGNIPPEQVMYGYIVKETNNMYYLSLYTYNKKKFWMGWAPKKSVKIET